MELKILVVDDSSIMRQMIIRTINLCGLDIADIFEAGNGREGLRVLEDKTIDLLFADVNMPVMNGIEMLNEVRQQKTTQGLPVLIVSTESHEGRIDEIEQQGAGFVHKPFTPEDLRAKIIEVLDM